jgi:serpin B
MVLALLVGAAAQGAADAPLARTPDMARSINAFAADMYAQARGKEGNVFFSPYSISAALAMTFAGARGETADQMAKVLRFREDWRSDPGAVHDLYALLARSLDGQGKPYELAVANRLWGQKGFGFLPEFLGLLQRKYGAGLEEVDFVTNTEGARQTINNWVESKTAQKVKDLLSPGVLDPRTTVLVLTNAIYFKGAWLYPFDKQRTADGDFFVSADRKVAVPMMRQTRRFRHADAGDLQVLEMDYKGDALSMVVLLPKKADGLAPLEQSLAQGKLDDLLPGLKEAEVAVLLPRFKMEWKAELQEPLGKMGMPLAFTGNADFSGMTGRKGDICISKVIHKAFVDVNEEGTEAAAATAVIMARGMPAKPVVFRADHPFIFLIRDKASGCILFLGRVANPKE